jgi:hypothetical protein
VIGPALIALLTACGFEVLIPGGMTVAEQIPTLAEAAHVVAPHRTARRGLRQRDRLPAKQRFPGTAR